jgi:5-methylcytosine-specific restriction enzyme subunit McrC
MDIVLKDKGSGEPIAVLDTKYKRTLDQAEDDIKQMVAYAVEIGVSRAFLVYPSYHAQLLKAKVGNIGVSTITFDISSQLDRAGIAFLKQLTDSLRVSSS